MQEARLGSTCGPGMVKWDAGRTKAQEQSWIGLTGNEQRGLSQPTSMVEDDSLRESVSKCDFLLPG